MRSISSALLISNPCFASFQNFPRSYAPSPVWSGSVRGSVKFQPIPRKERAAIARAAREHARERVRTAGGRHRSRVGASALVVFDALAFYFYNAKTGQLDPSYQGLADATGLSRATVARALKLLRSLGLVHWVRRCSVVMEEGRAALVQLTNAYAINPPSLWRFFRAAPARQVQPHEWGAVPMLPDTVTQACADAKLGGGVDLAAMVGTLETDAGDKLARVLARVGRLLAADTAEVSNRD